MCAFIHDTHTYYINTNNHFLINRFHSPSSIVTAIALKVLIRRGDLSRTRSWRFICFCSLPLQGSCLPVNQLLVSFLALSASITNTALRARASARVSAPRCSRPPPPPPAPPHTDQPPPLEPSVCPTTPHSTPPSSSDKAGSHPVGPVFPLSSVYTFYCFSNPPPFPG